MVVCSGLEISRQCGGAVHVRLSREPAVENIKIDLLLIAKYPLGTGDNLVQRKVIKKTWEIPANFVHRLMEIQLPPLHNMQ